MRPFGRHKASYRDLNPQSKSHKAEILPCDNRLRNIANADFEKGRLVIECWPSTNKTGRKWGWFQKERALILHFKIRARHEKSLTLDEFEFSIMFGLTEGDFDKLEESPEDRKIRDESIALIDLPSPDHIEGRKQNSSVEGQVDSWLFRGESLGNPSSGAKWCWEGNTSETPLLHTGLALLHPSKPFLGRCYVKGRATRLRRRFRFDNELREAVYVRFVPEDSEECLDQVIGELNDLIKARINGNSSESPDIATVRKSYGASSIGGSAIVQLGDIYNIHRGGNGLPGFDFNQYLNGHLRVTTDRNTSASAITQGFEVPNHSTGS